MEDVKFKRPAGRTFLAKPSESVEEFFPGFGPDAGGAGVAGGAGCVGKIPPAFPAPAAASKGAGCSAGKQVRAAAFAWRGTAGVNLQEKPGRCNRSVRPDAD